MSAKGTKPTVSTEDAPTRESSDHAAEGVGVFRAILLTILFYAALGGAIWFAWDVWRHWRH